MKGQELILVFREDMAFLTEEVALDFKQVDISSAPVKFQAPAFWTIRVINHIQNENRLFVEVLAYQVGERQFPANQVALYDTLITIEKVTFKSIDTTGLLRTLNSRGPVRILPPKPENVYRNDGFQRKPIKQRFTETFTVPFKNVSFLSGGVAFEKKLPGFKNPIEFQILNVDIIEEFDAIKNYFANVLHTKKIEVVANIETEDGAITTKSATSVEIQKIDKTIIEEVKLAYVKAARIKEIKTDQQMFTMEEYFETYADKNSSTQPFFEEDNQFFESVLENSDSKHYNHLRFLSSKHRADIMKLRFVHNPFSFIFLLSGADGFYVVWETLDTQEATYIWSINTDISFLKQMLDNIDKTIKLIKAEGKNEYIKLNKENFGRVFHDYIDIEHGFKNWKDEIEKIIHRPV